MRVLLNCFGEKIILHNIVRLYSEKNYLFATCTTCAGSLLCGKKSVFLLYKVHVQGL